MQHFDAFIIMNLFHGRLIHLKWAILEVNESYHMTHIVWTIRYCMVHTVLAFWPFFKLPEKPMGRLLLQTRWCAHCFQFNNFNFFIYLYRAQVWFLFFSQIQKISTEKDGKLLSTLNVLKDPLRTDGRPGTSVYGRKPWFYGMLKLWMVGGITGLK